MEKTINIQYEANITAKGKHSNGNCDPCIILETGETFTSQIDLAKRLEVTACAVSSVICGRQRTLKGYHIVSMSRLTEGADLVLTRLRETSAMEDDARKWREYQAELERKRKEEEARIEAERKAEEKRLEDERKAKEAYEKAVAKAIGQIERRHAICSRLEQKYNEAVARAMEAEMEYEALTGKAYGATEEDVA